MKAYVFLCFIISFISAGAQQWQWAKKVNAPAGSVRQVLVSDAGNVFLLISSGGNTSVVKFNDQGDQLWIYSYNAVTCEIAADADENVYAVGYFSGQVQVNNLSYTSSGQNDIFCLKLGMNGTFSWIKHINSNENEYSTAITVDTAGDPVIAGYFSDTLTVDSKTVISSGQGLFLLKMNASNGVGLLLNRIGTLKHPSVVSLTGLRINDRYTVSGRFDNNFLYFSNDSVGSQYYEGNVFVLKSDTNYLSIEQFWQDDYQNHIVNSELTEDGTYYICKNFRNQYGYHYVAFDPFNSLVNTYGVGFPGAGPYCYSHLNSGIQVNTSDDVFKGGDFADFNGNKAMHDGIVIDAGHQNGKFISKHDQAGSLEWIVSFANQNELNPFLMDAGGTALYIAADLNSSVTLGADSVFFDAPGDIMVAKLDTDLLLSDARKEEGRIQLYPNPATSEIYINTGENEMIRIVDMNGRILLQSRGWTDKTKLDVSSIAPGIYMILINGNGKIRTGKFTVNR